MLKDKNKKKPIVQEEEETAESIEQIQQSTFQAYLASLQESETVEEGEEEAKYEEPPALKPVVNVKPLSTKDKIIKVMDKMKELLLYKNEMYGDSALNPENGFYKGGAANSILIRLDDKYRRIVNRKTDYPRPNDIMDMIGYLVLLLVSLNVKESDFDKEMD